MKNKKPANPKTVPYMAKAAIIAAIYCSVSYISQPIAFGVLQLRIAEALSLLTMYTSSAVPGLFVGCLLANLLSPYGPLDVIAGSLATLLAALISRRFRGRFLCGLPYVIFNAFIISGVIAYQSGSWEMFWMQVVIIGAEEALSVYLLGFALTILMEKSGIAKRFIID